MTAKRNPTEGRYSKSTNKTKRVGESMLMLLGSTLTVSVSRYIH